MARPNGSSSASLNEHAWTPDGTLDANPVRTLWVWTLLHDTIWVGSQFPPTPPSTPRSTALYPRPSIPQMSQCPPTQPCTPFPHLSQDQQVRHPCNPVQHHRAMMPHGYTVSISTPAGKQTRTTTTIKKSTASLSLDQFDNRLLLKSWTSRGVTLCHYPWPSCCTNKPTITGFESWLMVVNSTFFYGGYRGCCIHH